MVGLGLVFLLMEVVLPAAQPKVEVQAPQLVISVDRTRSRDTGRAVVQGTFGMWVACGSQLSIWSQFPREIQFKVTDLVSGHVLETNEELMSVSYDRQTIDFYGRMPCDRFVVEPFSVDLDEKFSGRLGGVASMKVEASLLGAISNSIALERR